MDHDPATLCLDLAEQFRAGPYPGDDQIVLDNSAEHLESRRIKASLKGKPWESVSFETLTELQEALPFLSPQGYRFYLPAFMVFSIVDFARAGLIPDAVVRSLTPPRTADIRRLRDLAGLHPEVQPFDAVEWEGILATIGESYKSGDAERTFLERVRGLTTGQVKLIRRFLEYMETVHGAEFPSREPRIALDRYWESK